MDTIIFNNHTDLSCLVMVRVCVSVLPDLSELAACVKSERLSFQRFKIPEEKSMLLYLVILVFRTTPMFCFVYTMYACYISLWFSPLLMWRQMINHQVTLYVYHCNYISQ